MTAVESPLLAAAFAYAARGWHVLPLHSIRDGRCTCGKPDCPSPAKHPLTALVPRGFKNATIDPAVIRDWWTQCPWANVAIATGSASGLVVLDVDNRNDGDTTLDVLQHEHGPLPATPTVLTGGGGQHYYFAHPGGHVGSRTGLFVGIDLRGDAGYVVAPPSLHASGQVYCWHRSPDEGDGLPTAPEPEWVAAARAATREAPQADPPRHDRNGHDAGESLLRRAAAWANAKPGVGEGQRNSAAFSLAGNLAAMTGEHGERLGERDILDLARSWNARNTPPLGDGELRQAVRSAFSGNGTPRPEKPDRPRQAAANAASGSNQPPPESTIRPQYQTASDLMQHHPRLRPPVIDGLLREGETLNLIAPQKTGKSWLVLDLALALTTGRPWLGRFDTTAGNVLILDNELHGETIASRIPKVAGARGIPEAEYGERLYVDSLRGRLVDRHQMRCYFDAIEPGTFRAIVLDAFYRFLPRESDENSNADVSGLYNSLDQYAGRLGCSFVLVHHASKGNQSGKSVTDVGAGAGAQSRAADTHLILRAHETAGAVTMDGAIRSFPPVDPFCLTWTHPVWSPAADLDPAALKPERPRRQKQPDAGKPAPAPWTAERFASEFITSDGQTEGAILDRAAVARLSENRAEKLLRRAVDAGLVHCWQRAANQPKRYASEPESLMDGCTPKTAPEKRNRKPKSR